MRKFRGSFEDLQARVAITGIDGEWIERELHKQYRADSGAVLNFWESTGTVNFQGSPVVAKELEAAVFRSNGVITRASKPDLNTGRPAVDDPALQVLTSVVIRNRLGPILEEEMAQAGEIAQECILDLCELLGLATQTRQNNKVVWRGTKQLHQLAAGSQFCLVQDPIVTQGRAR